MMTNMSSQAFERVTASALHGPKKGSLWRLTDKALREGHVISTTRYRKDPKRKPERKSPPALKRQKSGAKGGQATRAASVRKRLEKARNAGSHLPNGSNPFPQGPRRQEVPSFTPSFAPNSVPGSYLPTTAPHQVWQPVSMQHTFLPPPSPSYCLPATETGEFCCLPPPLSTPNTPDEILVGFPAPQKSLASPSAAFGSLTEFELGYHDQALGTLFGNHDGFEPNTPSLATEMSFATDEMTPASMRMSTSVETSRS